MNESEHGSLYDSFDAEEQEDEDFEETYEDVDCGSEDDDPDLEDFGDVSDNGFEDEDGWN